MNAISVVTTFETDSYQTSAIEIAKEKLRLLDAENELLRLRRSLLYELECISGRLSSTQAVITLLHSDPVEYFRLKKMDEPVFRIIRNDY